MIRRMHVFPFIISKNVLSEIYWRMIANFISMGMKIDNLFTKSGSNAQDDRHAQNSKIFFSRISGLFLRSVVSARNIRARKKVILDVNLYQNMSLQLCWCNINIEYSRTKATLLRSFC